MVGAFVIILDPIFQGLAVSLLFGVGASTLLTLVVIPVLYVTLMKRSRPPEPTRGGWREGGGSGSDEPAVGSQLSLTLKER